MDFSLLHSFPESGDLSAEWNDLAARGVTNSPFQRYEYLRAWWEGRGGGEWPEAELALIIARQEGRLAGIAPLFLTPSREHCASLMLLGSVEISDFLDLVVPASSLPSFLPGLLDLLSRPASDLGLSQPWRLLDWHNLLADSATLPALKAEAEERGWKVDLQPTYHAPCISLPGDFEAYLSGIDKKQRHEIRRKMRRALEDGQNVRWYIVDNSGDVASAMQDFFHLMADNAEKAFFLTPAMRSQMLAIGLAAARAGWLQLAFLEVDGRKAAAYLNFDYDNRIWVYNSGIDRSLMDVSPGWVLLGHLLEWANENKRREFDFMRGDEDYKYRFGGLDRRLARLQVERK
jgi:CelD/BcsL family acetyltransferase involved in cellulose biosynthesis